ncbi:MAG: DUF502 domain-containing protein [Planctomycetota bacterium]|nr:DUF502 domain-containing protein [Planctomycetota bacterium]
MAKRIRLSIAQRITYFLRTNFVAGMFIALPLGVTVGLLVWIWGKMLPPLNFIFGITKDTDLIGSITEAFKGSQYSLLLPPLLGLTILLLSVLILGIITRSFLGRFFLGIFENFVAHVPIIGVLYSSIKQLGEAFISDEGTSRFQSAVLVQFPMEGSWVIGFVTGTAYAPLAETMAGPLRKDAEKRGVPPPDIITVFVPTTPLPTQGFTLVLPRSETRELPIGVEEAIKLVISGGIISNPANSHRQQPVTDVELAPKKPAPGAPQKA